MTRHEGCVLSMSVCVCVRGWGGGERERPPIHLFCDRTHESDKRQDSQTWRNATVSNTIMMMMMTTMTKLDRYARVYTMGQVRCPTRLLLRFHSLNYSSIFYCVDILCVSNSIMMSSRTCSMDISSPHDETSAQSSRPSLSFKYSSVLILREWAMPLLIHCIMVEHARWMCSSLHNEIRTQYFPSFHSNTRVWEATYFESPHMQGYRYMYHDCCCDDVCLSPCSDLSTIYIKSWYIELPFRQSTRVWHGITIRHLNGSLSELLERFDTDMIHFTCLTLPGFLFVLFVWDSFKI